ncbi:MAG: hypothetical protein R3F34_19265 [Planctomycetota bacterium]
MRGTSEEWSAESNDLVLVADDPLQLLGLLLVRRTRGREWRAGDEEIDAVLKEFGTIDS